MNGAQKTIKGLAVALAIVIMVSVLSTCVGAGMILSRVFSPNNAVVMEGD
jgi:preprotein translocase subunit SecD